MIDIKKILRIMHTHTYNVRVELTFYFDAAVGAFCLGLAYPIMIKRLLLLKQELIYGSGNLLPTLLQI